MDSTQCGKNERQARAGNSHTHADCRHGMLTGTSHGDMHSQDDKPHEERQIMRTVGTRREQAGKYQYEVLAPVFFGGAERGGGRPWGKKQVTTGFPGL